ncbi:MAG: methyl-accepting chemotaxis protein [Methylococcus sp.]
MTARHIRTLRMKILLWAGPPVIAMLGLVVLILGVNLYRDLHEASLFRIQSEAMAVAGRIDAWNLETVTVARVMADAQENGLFGNRRASLALARRILEENHQFTGAYFGYEPNADGQDAEFVRLATDGEKPAMDATGRFIPYWFRDSRDKGVIRLSPLLNMETSLYYQGLKNRLANRPELEGIQLAGEVSRHFDPSRSTLALMGKTMVTEPYVYEGKMIVEQTYPIMIQGRFAGVAGVDRALDEISAFIRARKPYATAEFMLISHRGRVISATLDRSLETLPIEKTPWSDLLAPIHEAAPAATEQVRLAPGPEAGHPFIYAIAQVPTGDWTLVMRVAREEILAPVWASLRIVAVTAGVGLALSLIFLGWLTTTVSRPIGAAAQAARQVAEGDLTTRIVATGSDEIGRLLTSLRDMTANLNHLIGRVQHSSGMVQASATQIQEAAGSQQALTNELSSATTETSAAATEISATSRELAKTMSEVSEQVRETARLAHAGHAGIEGMESIMHDLAASTGVISARLGAISDHANNITGVITTITQVADQTNLLSLNAAIEAVKAGEYGRGFVVVAEEIRNLANQTAVAALDIERMVVAMQGSVSTGVREMERFDAQVREGVASIGQVSHQLADILEKVQQLTPRFETLDQGMRSQSDGAGEISTAMVELTGVARTTSLAVVELNQASRALHAAIQELREGMSHFKVAEAE